MLADYFTKPLQGALFHQFRDIIMGRVSPFTLLEDTFSYTSKERAGKNISLRGNPLGTGEPLKERTNMFEDKNDKQVRTSIGGPLKKERDVQRQKGKTSTYLH